MKIKKYALSILILIALAGFFLPVAQVNADAYDDCVAEKLSSGNMQNALDECYQVGYTTSNDCSNIMGAKPRLQHLLSYGSCIITSSVIPLIFALAVVMFVWGVVQYVINTDDEAKKTKGKQFMLWGIIALTVMVSVWGLVAILGNTFGIEYVIPQVKP